MITIKKGVLQATDMSFFLMSTKFHVRLSPCETLNRNYINVY